MPDHPEYPQHQHLRPFVDETLTSKTLYFSECDIQSRMQIGRPDLLSLSYTRLMMGFLLLVPRPRSIAMVGLGGGSLAKFCYRYLPRSRIEVIETQARHGTAHCIAHRIWLLRPGPNWRPACRGSKRQPDGNVKNSPCSRFSREDAQYL